MNVTKRCSKCRKTKPGDNYGLKKNGTEYLTCMTCRKKQPPTSLPSSSSQFHNCLGGCVNPSDGLHHRLCPNYTPPPTNFEDVFALNRAIAERNEQRMHEQTNMCGTSNLTWKKGFLTSKPKTEPEPSIPVIPNTCSYEEIYQTFINYGVDVYTTDDIHHKYFNHYDFFPIKLKLQTTKSVFGYQVSCPPTKSELQFCNEILSIRVNVKRPILIVMLYTETQKLSITCTPYVNVFENFVHVDKLKNRKRCNICQEKKKCFRVCHRCNDKYCVDCFYSLHDDAMKPCPYCRYSFGDHIQAKLKQNMMMR